MSLVQIPVPPAGLVLKPQFPHLRNESCGAGEQSVQGLALAVGPPGTICCHFLLRYSPAQPGSRADEREAWIMALALQGVLCDLG